MKKYTLVRSADATFFAHANPEALLQATILALVAVVLVYLAVSV